eukprot:gene202-gene343
MIHILVVDNNVVLGCHVICDVVIDDQTQQTIQQGKINLLTQLFKFRFKESNALAFTSVPYIRQVIDTDTILVHKQWRWFGIGRLDPVREETTVIGFVPEILIEVGVGNLFKRFDVVDWHKNVVEILELDGHFFERTLGQQVTLDTRQSFMRIIIRLFDKTKFFTLSLIQTSHNTITFLQTFQRKNQELGIMLVVERWERNRSELTRLQPMHSSSVNGNSLFTSNVRTILEVSMLTFLFGLQPKTRKTSKIFLTDGLVNGSTTTDTFTIVVGLVGPPIGLRLDVTQNHVLDRSRETRNLPWNVRLPATPSFGQMLQDGTGLVRLHTLRHHIDNIMHNCGTQLKIEMRFNTLFGNGFGDTLSDTTFELPTFKKRNDTTKEEQPDTPSWSPETTTGTLTDRTGVETVVDDMLKILAHTHLTHQTILVTVHTGELTNMREDILKTISKLESINVTKTVLNHGIDDQLTETENLTAKMESVTETRLLTFLGGQGLDRLQIEIVIKMQVVQVLTMDQQVKHVVTLTADLQTNLNPIQFRSLEKLGTLEKIEKITLLEGTWRTGMQLIQNPTLQQLLVRHTNLNRMAGRTMLTVPGGNERNILRTTHTTTTHVERSWRPVKSDTVHSVIVEKRSVDQERFNFFWKFQSFNLFDIIFGVIFNILTVGRKRVHDRIVVESWKIRIVRLHVAASLMMVDSHGNLTRTRIVEVRESNLVLGTNLET